MGPKVEGGRKDLNEGSSLQELKEIPPKRGAASIKEKRGGATIDFTTKTRNRVAGRLSKYPKGVTRKPQVRKGGAGGICVIEGGERREGTCCVA